MSTQEELDGYAASANGAREDIDVGELVRAFPGLARIAIAAWLRAAGWTVETAMRTATRVVGAAAAGESAAQFFAEAGAELRGYLREVLGISDSAVDPARKVRTRGRPPEPGTTTEALRERGAELLRQSADVRVEEGAHPAYMRILDELAPDEARILRLLAADGPQPSVDVRAGLPLVSELVAPGRTMIGAEAGCRRPERIHAYLNNLYRLGLIWFSREPITGHDRYQVLEAQPDVVEAMRKGGRTARTVRRSIVLTPFGKDFCDLVLPSPNGSVRPVGADPVGEAATGNGSRDRARRG